MERVIAILSMLHEPADRHSASRLFRGKPVLDWTLRRLQAASSIDTVAILCWQDQVEAVNPTAENRKVGVISKGVRQVVPNMEAITAARRWSDGWRSGLLGTCEFDLGFHPGWVNELIALHEADAVMLIDPAAGLLDSVLVESLIEYVQTQPDAELCFMQAAPGLAGTLLRKELVERLSIANVHPGRLLTYFPDQHGVDPIGKPGCAPVPTPVARSTYRFKLDSDRQIARVDLATVHLNGHLVSTEAEDLTISMRGSEIADRLPREVVLELNTNRATKPSYWPGKHVAIDRPNLSVAMAEEIFRELCLMDDVRVTIAGIGDPLLAPECFDIIAAAKSAGITAIGIETDLLWASTDDIRRLVVCGVDVISIHFPAATSPTYAAVMGIDGFSRVLQNVTLLEEQVKLANIGTPLIAPIFTKLAANLGEMELWYDYWIRRSGHAVIAGPSDFAQQIPDLAVADMASPVRRPCSRLSSRMTVLSDGQVVSCEQDFLGKQTMGIIGQTPIQEIWQQSFGSLRKCHQNGEWASKPFCGRCREWHRS
jgi:2-C-methyl-D-erythritol 4-phosphate cytidylyltransferase